MLITIDPASEASLFDQIAASVRMNMATGLARPGTRLPSARDVAASLDVNLHTVLRAYQILRDEGLVDMRRGRGAVVTDAAAHLHELHSELKTLVAKAHVMGLGPDALASLVRDVAALDERPPSMVAR